MCIISLPVTEATYVCTFTVPDNTSYRVSRGSFSPSRYPELAQCTIAEYPNTNFVLIEPGAWLGSEHLKQLILYGNQLTALAPRTFENLYLLELLNLTANQIASIDVETFSNLTSLTVLDLSQNSISVLQRDMFMDLTSLESLILDRNQITLIEDGVFNSLHSLNKLALESNNLNSSILTSSNALANVADTLTSLFLLGNRFDAIYNDMLSRFTELEQLSITAENIEEPNGFRGLNSLEDLSVTGLHMDVDSNTWSHIGDTLAKLALQFDSLESLKGNMFERTPKLRYLSLESSNISIFRPTTFNGLNSIEHISLLNNSISEEEIKNLQNVRGTLMRLELSRNRIAAIPKDIFDGFTALTYLSLSSNRISILIEGGFIGLQSLTQLDLSQNAISAVEPGPFEGLSSLRTLYLTDNLLKTLEWTAFSLRCVPYSGKYPIYIH